MAVFGSFVYGSGAVYGSDSSIVSIVPVSKNIVKITVDLDLVVTPNMFVPGNYEIRLADPAADPGLTPTGALLPVRKVLPNNSSAITTEVLLLTETQTEGTLYHLSVVTGALLARNGASVIGSGRWYSRKTKVDSAMSSIPGHFSRDPAGRIHAVVCAITSSDEVIGGSRNDLLP